MGPGRLVRAVSHFVRIRGLVAMLKYGVFVFVFVATVIVFFVGLFLSILPLVLGGAVMLVALFFTRRIFIPTQDS